MTLRLGTPVAALARCPGPIGGGACTPQDEHWEGEAPAVPLYLREPWLGGSLALPWFLDAIAARRVAALLEYDVGVVAGVSRVLEKPLPLRRGVEGPARQLPV